MIQSAIILNKRSGTLFTTTVMARQNDFSRKFTQEDGFQVAFAVIDYASYDFTDVYGQNLTDYIYPYVYLYENNEEDQENSNPEYI